MSEVGKKIRKNNWLALRGPGQREQISDQDHDENAYELELTHRLSSLGEAVPQQHDKGENAGGNVEVQECHEDRSLVVRESMMAIPRKNMVITRPIVNVTQGTPRTVPGTKSPTTSEPKTIFAPSRKNAANTSEELFISSTSIASAAGSVKREAVRS